MGRLALKAHDAFFAAVGALAAALVCWSVFGAGIPSLRHDWHSPIIPSAFDPWLQSLFQPWLQIGLGVPQPYPTFFLVGMALWPFHGILNIGATLELIVGFSAFAASSAGARLGRNAGLGIASIIPAGAAVFNPWVYSKLVAGHIFMVLAYALLLLLFAEVTRERPRTPSLVILSALCITQIEFFVVTVLPLGYYLYRRRQWSALSAMGLCALPVAIGIAAHYTSIVQTEYTLAWQQGQSVAPSNGILLLGYGFEYASSFAPLKPALAVLAAIAICGLIAKRREARYATLSTVAALALLYASGTSWILAPAYTWLVAHVPQSGVFREMYDLIAFVAIAYVAGLAAIPKWRWRFPILIIAGVASYALCVPWITKPVFSFFVPAEATPQIAFPSDPTHRIALFPAFQPITLAGRGSGYDPDLFAQQGGSSPVNDFLPSFPVDAALSYAWFQHDFRMLTSLSVSSVVDRPALKTDWKTLQFQQAFLHDRPLSLGNTRLNAPAVFSTAYGIPSTTNDPQDLRSNAVFSPAGSFEVRRLGSRDFNVREHWIDSRLAQLTNPAWSTASGGAVTSSAAPLPIPSGSSVLAWVKGTLYTGRGVRIAQNVLKLRWLPLPQNTRILRCSGICMVSLISPKPEVPSPAKKTIWQDALEQPVTPWLFTLSLPPSQAVRTIRFAETYDPYWAAYAGTVELKHVKLNSIFNGWILPRGGAEHVIVIERLAAIQIGLELLAMIGTCAIALTLALQSLRAR